MLVFGRGLGCWDHFFSLAPSHPIALGSLVTPHGGCVQFWRINVDQPGYASSSWYFGGCNAIPYFSNTIGSIYIYHTRAGNSHSMFGWLHANWVLHYVQFWTWSSTSAYALSDCYALLSWPLMPQPVVAPWRHAPCSVGKFTCSSEPSLKLQRDCSTHPWTMMCLGWG